MCLWTLELRPKCVLWSHSGLDLWPVTAKVQVDIWSIPFLRMGWTGGWMDNLKTQCLWKRGLITNCNIPGFNLIEQARSFLDENAKESCGPVKIYKSCGVRKDEGGTGSNRARREPAPQSQYIWLDYITTIVLIVSLHQFAEHKTVQLSTWLNVWCEIQPLCGLMSVRVSLQIALKIS